MTATLPWPWPKPAQPARPGQPPKQPKPPKPKKEAKEAIVTRRPRRRLEWLTTLVNLAGPSCLLWTVIVLVQAADLLYL